MLFCTRKRPLFEGSGKMLCCTSPLAAASNVAMSVEPVSAEPMALGTQIVWLFVLAIPVASISWTVTHEDIFREARQRCVECSRQSRWFVSRKFFYLFTCEYCFSHWVALLALLLSGYRLLLPDWRGYLLAFFALPFVANFYLGLYAQTKLEATKDRYGAKVIEHEAEIKAMEKDQMRQEARQGNEARDDQRTREETWREPAA